MKYYLKEKYRFDFGDKDESGFIRAREQDIIRFAKEYAQYLELLTKNITTMEMPKKYQDLVGTKQTFSGGLFSSKKSIPETEFDVLDWRWGLANIIDLKTLEAKHPTVEYLVKNQTMKASRWTRPFPVREIKLERKGGAS